ncbi:Alpha-L-fucosidase [Novipirellula aureliae]|uniref:alpha-L-fucosidase n=1 Tax=Novipirellula aureliae TaxID=2527966 RepID=A0A5C6EAT5_9BACT|nr:alpha-L-fucosidase [Novipirellula aureliae]TWU44279.1 Alpha-L-fucosidase [Novipirellula aureliae]
MKLKTFLLAACLGGLMQSGIAVAQTQAAEESRQWLKDAKFGMFIHFDVDKRNISTWNPSNLDTDEWVRIAKQAGMKYVVPTTHQSSYIVMWDSEVSSRDVTDLTPFRQPYLKELSESCKAAGLRMGAYYAIADPGNPLYNEDGSDIKPYVEYLHAVIKELCEQHQPLLIWFDASRRFKHPEQKELLRRAEMVEMLHSYGTLSNSRLGDDDGQRYVDYLTMNDNMAPDFNLGVPWESAVTITTDGSWHFTNANAELRSPKELLHRLINAAGNGGNLLLNVGPDPQGVIPKNMEERLKTLGQWLEKNGEAIHGTQPGPYPYQISWGSITQRKDEGNTNLYLNVLDWPETGKFTLFGLQNKVLQASLLATGKTIDFQSNFDANSGQNIVTLDVPETQPDDYVSVIKLVVAGDAVMDQDHLQLTDGKVLLDTYNATIHDLEFVPEKPTKAIDMKMFTVAERRPQQPSDYKGPWDYQMYKKPGEGIMPARGITVSGFQTKGQALSWDFKIYEPGRYDVVAVCHVTKGSNWQVRGRVRAHVAGQTVENQLVESKRVETITVPKYLELHSVLGTVEIDSSGAHTLTLEIAENLTGAKPNFQRVELVPSQR